MPRLGFNLYAGAGNEIRKWSAVGSTSISGMGDLLIPILIAALIVLNTMLGAVFERVKEIHIFSSIGLAPSHIATLFMAESFVYAILGAIFGYLIGQGMAKIITVTGWLPGLVPELLLPLRGGLHGDRDRRGAALHGLSRPQGLRGGDAGHRAPLARAGPGGRQVGDPDALRRDRRPGDRAHPLHGGVVPGL